VQQRGQLSLIADLHLIVVLVGELTHAVLEVEVAEVLVEDIAFIFQILPLALSPRLDADRLGGEPEDVEQCRQG
jgi:uncharacterized membrane protein